MYCLLLLIYVAIFILYIYDIIVNKKIETFEQEQKIIFTCTSYISFENKFEELQKALDSFIEYNSNDLHLISEFLIINEYSEDKDIDNKLNILKSKYPMFKIIHKTEDQKGQAKSINMIIDHLKENKYKYWLHWEESWYCTKPILKKAYNIMENSNISQLQFIKAWLNVLHRKDINHKIFQDHIEIKPTNNLIKLWNNTPPTTLWYSGILWPLFSLSPGIDRVENILKVGYFSEDPKKWPVQFEFEWALKWVNMNNIIKGVFKNPVVFRKKTHISTYINK